MFQGIVELRTKPRTTLKNQPITADEEIVQLVPDITNNIVSFFTIQANFEDAGKLYIVDENGNEMYLTDPSVNYPSKFQIISTIIIDRDGIGSLRYTTTTTAGKIIITEGAGVY